MQREMPQIDQQLNQVRNDLRYRQHIASLVAGMRMLDAYATIGSVIMVAGIIFFAIVIIGAMQ